jgi:hypothetical protein
MKLLNFSGRLKIILKTWPEISVLISDIKLRNIVLQMCAI